MRLNSMFLVLAVALTSVWPLGAAESELTLDPRVILEVAPLAIEALAIQHRAAEREAQHRAELAARGVAEEPPCAAERYTLDAGLVGKLAFNLWGEFYIDRRFVTDEEMKTVKAIEQFFRKWFPNRSQTHQRSEETYQLTVAGQQYEVPMFRGFEDSRYQQYDALIVEMVSDFNAHKEQWCGGSFIQALKIPDLTPAMVKSHMIEESGGRGARSQAAWAVDPLQVNVPGDWGPEKELLGLTRPERRNEGTLRDNIRAAIMYLARKGFGVSGRPAADRPQGFFDSWNDAYRRYNGRRDRTDTDRYYSDEYADKILRRASNPDVFVPIEIKLARKAS